MTGGQARSLGRLPLHGGWSVLRLTDPVPQRSLPPGQLATVAADNGRLALPVYQRDGESISLLAPPASISQEGMPPRDAAVDVRYPEQAWPRQPGAEQEALVLGINAGLGGALAVATWLETVPALVIVGGSAGVPARPRPSRYLVPQLPPGVIAALPQLEEQGIPSRIALDEWLPGCFDEGPVELLHRYLAELGHGRRERTVLHAFVPGGALDAVLPGLRETLAGVHVTGVPAQGNA